MTFDEWFVRNNDGDDSGKDIAEYAWKAGAASRNAEIAELVEALENCRDWFERQARVTSKGGPSSWELLLLRDEMDNCETALAKVRKPT